MATLEGTQRFVQRLGAALHPGNARRLGPFACTAIGFGAYRLESEAQLPALRKALRRVNVVDTSSHYAGGESERLVGRVLREAAEAEELTREEVVVCTKVGHVAKGQQPKGSVPVGAHQGEGGSEDDWHCIEPAFVDSEVRGCRERLGSSPDFVLLHNPEYLLAARLQQKVPIHDAWDEMYQALFEAFKALEQLCSDGTITTGYGVSSNFLSCLFSVTGRPNLYEALVLDRVVDAADAAAKALGEPAHRFKVAQLPLNAFESGAILGRGSAVEAEPDCPLAQRLGISLVTNRPLNALPMPGVGTGDWGRGAASHLQLREAKPMGTMASLLKRVVREAADLPEAPLQQLALRLAVSAEVACTLNGARREPYVEDVAAVLRQEPLPRADVEKILRAVRSLAEELSCDKNRLW
mmetsp:Transcript_67828/g.150275  ORF Transcript_67828/g.150275 Transcript_67828/m.150275 type:complete len:410 (+) Transcript_67828:24-1253(+)